MFDFFVLHGYAVSMSIPTDTPRGTRKARTYLPEASAREDILDFAEFMRTLEVFLAERSSKAALVDTEGNPRPIPDEIFEILEQVTNALASGEGITVVPQNTMMTTQQAADFLGISRPTLVRLLESGDIPFEQPGRHRRVRLSDLLSYQSKFRTERQKALLELQRANMNAKIQVGNPADVQRNAEL
jgi:excisionase family DNA binding protein